MDDKYLSTVFYLVHTCNYCNIDGEKKVVAAGCIDSRGKKEETMIY
jgi:hypothetical protein